MAEPLPGNSPTSPIFSRRMSKHKINFQVLQAEDPLRPAHISLEDLLLEASRKTTVRALVPEWLVQTGPASHYLMATEMGGVVVSHGSRAFNKFFELVDLAVVREKTRDMAGQVPKYIVKSSNNALHLCMTQDECTLALSQALGKCSVLRYIQAKGPKPCLYRVHFRLGKGVTVYMVKNCRRSEAMRRFTELRNPGFQTKQLTIYQHKATDFVYAGKLHKASFSPYLPYKSLLVPPSPRTTKAVGGSISVSPQISPLGSPRPSIYSLAWPKANEITGRELDYIVDTRHMHQCKVFEVEDKIPTLENAIGELIESLERGYRRRNIAKLSVDVINTESEEWVLVDCSELEWQENPHPRGADMRAKLDNLDRLSLNRHIEFESPAFLSASQSDRILRKSPISPKSRLCGPEERLAQSQLSSVQAKYDGIITQARRSKLLSKDLVADISAAYNSTKQLESVLEKAWTSISKELSSDKKDGEQAKEILLEVLSGNFRNTLKSTKVAMHRKLNFTAAQYAAFVQAVVLEANRLEMNEETLTLLQERLSFFQITS